MLKKPPQKVAYLWQLGVFFFSAAPTALNSPELLFRFITSFIRSSLLRSLYAIWLSLIIKYFMIMVSSQRIQQHKKLIFRRPGSEIMYSKLGLFYSAAMVFYFENCPNMLWEKKLFKIQFKKVSLNRKSSLNQTWFSLFFHFV